MIEIPREVFTNDEVFSILHLNLMAIHQVAPHTEKVLLANKHVKDFCEEARHFVIMTGAGSGDYFISYDVSSWLKDTGSVLVRIDNITVYDTFMEYERERMKVLSSKDGHNPSIN